ncbi:hypothetical protein ACH5RR_015975 [Cinchona calisaya]|uniref:Uncharacterized protein n=1 Tax=Cinchona calisaya TaxID=153742 RepID=A0ABD2ZUL1_9GENT
MRSSLVEDGLIRSFEFHTDESSSQHGPTTFGFLDDLESFMSSVPSNKGIYNLFYRGKEICHLENETDDELFDYAPLNDSTPYSMTAQQESSEGESCRSHIDDLILPLQVINVSYGSMQEILTTAAQAVKSNFLNYLFSMNPLDSGTIVKEANNVIKFLSNIPDVSSMKNLLNILDGEINKLETSLPLIQTRCAAEAQTLNKHESILINPKQKLLALKIEFDDLKSSPNRALAEEKVHSEDSEKLTKAVEALKNQLLL